MIWQAKWVSEWVGQDKSSQKREELNNLANERMIDGNWELREAQLLDFVNCTILALPNS